MCLHHMRIKQFLGGEDQEEEGERRCGRMSSQEAAQALHHGLDGGGVAHHCPVVL